MDFNTSRKDYYKTKRLLLTESFDMNYPVDDDSDTDTDALSTIWLNSEMKTEHFDVPENSERDISIDDNISVIGKLQENFRQEIGHESNQELQTSYLKHEDSISQMISKSFLEGLPDHEDSLSEEEKYIQQEWEKQIQLHKKDQICHSESYQEDEKPKMELSYTPRYTKHDVYYLFQYHLIEHALDWLFLPEEPNLLIELLSDQQAIYATQTLSMITDKMPEGEIMPCYFAFKGMISLFVSDFTKAFNYFDKASLVEDNILFLFWKIVSKFYIWMETRDFEDFSILKLLVSKFERLSQFNVNIKWIRLRIKLYEYTKIDKSDFALSKARDSALEIKSLNQYLGYIAWAEIYATTDQIDKWMEVLHDCIETEPNKTYAYIRLYHYNQKLEKPKEIFQLFLKIYLFLNDTADFVEQHNEVRHRLLALLFIRVCASEGLISLAIKTIWTQYQEDGDKLSLLMEFARIVTHFGNTEYVGEAMGVLEEIEMRGWIERNRDVYFLMAQIEILRGNIMIGYKLFMEALKHLEPSRDQKRIEYIESFILPYKVNIEKAIELE